MGRSRKATLPAGIAFAGLLVLIFHRLFLGEVLSPGAVIGMVPPFAPQLSLERAPYVNLVLDDVAKQFIWFERAQYQAALEGRFPEWNPSIWCGHALHADGQSAFLNPFHWIYFAIDPNWARGPMAMLRLWLSAMALFLLLRRHGASGTAAFVGGAIWMCSSFNVRWLLWPMTNNSLWLPVLLLALDAWLVLPTLRSFVVLCLASSVWMLGGHPGTQLWVGYIAVLYATLRIFWLARSRPSLKLTLLRGAGALASVAVGIAGASAALLPFLLEMRRSLEWAEGTRGEIGRTVVGQTLSLFVAPDRFGWRRCGYPYRGPDNYNETACWFGLTALALVLATMLLLLLPRRFRGAEGSEDGGRFLAVWGSVLFVLCVLAAFSFPPVRELLPFLPFTAVASPRRLLFGLHLAGAILAALGVDALLEGRSRVHSVVAVSLAALGVGTVAFLFWTEHRGALLVGSRTLSWELFLHHPSLRMLVQGFLSLLGASLLALVLAWTWRARNTTQGRGAQLRIALAAAIALEVSWAAWDQNPTAPIDIAQPPAPPSLQALAHDAGDGRIIATDALFDPNQAMGYGLRDVRGYDLPTDPRQDRAMKRAGIDRFKAGRFLDGARVYPALDATLAAFLDRCSTRYLMLCATCLGSDRVSRSLPVHGAEPWQAGEIGPSGELVFRNPNAYPRAYWARSALAVKPDEALDALLDPGRDLRERSVFEGDAAAPRSVDAAGSAMLRDDRPERVVIEAESPAGGLLVLADRMAPGWRVLVDHAPATALVANYLFRGVMVPAGRHEVAWIYDAPGLRAGAILSLVTLVSLLGLLLVSGRFPPRR